MAANDRMRKDTTTFADIVAAENAPVTPPVVGVDTLFNKLELVREPEGLYSFRYVQGGPPPAELAGKFTHARFAEAAKANWEQRAA